jgi:hypothetical protein
MPGPLVQQGAVVLCVHGGRAQPGTPNPRVTLSSAATVLVSVPWVVTGCPNPPASGGPCATAVWTAGSTRVTSMGQPLVIQGGTALCAPTSVPLTVVSAQPRVVVS